MIRDKRAAYVQSKLDIQSQMLSILTIQGFIKRDGKKGSWFKYNVEEVREGLKKFRKMKKKERETRHANAMVTAAIAKKERYARTPPTWSKGGEQKPIEPAVPPAVVDEERGSYTPSIGGSMLEHLAGLK